MMLCKSSQNNWQLLFPLKGENGSVKTMDLGGPRRSPAQRGGSPPQRGGPQPREGCPALRASPAQKEGCPALRGSPAQTESCPALRGSPAQTESCPALRGSPAQREGGSQPREGPQPRKRAAQLWGGPRPREGGPQPTEGGPQPREGGSQPREGVGVPSTTTMARTTCTWILKAILSYSRFRPKTDWNYNAGTTPTVVLFPVFTDLGVLSLKARIPHVLFRVTHNSLRQRAMPEVGSNMAWIPLWIVKCFPCSSQMPHFWTIFFWIHTLNQLHQYMYTCDVFVTKSGGFIECTCKNKNAFTL